MEPQDKHKPCPFCGKNLVMEDVEEHCYEIFVDVVACGNPECILRDVWMSPEVWNSRPIENDLLQMLRETEAILKGKFYGTEG